MHEAARTLVKSPPELWAELSDAEALGRHLGAFGEIRITRLEPEVAVAWEGTRASGTVGLEPAGWGTRVTLTAEEHAPQPRAEPVAETPPVPTPVAEEPPAEEPVAEEPPVEEPVAEEPKGLRGLLARLFGRRPEEEPAAPAEEPRADAPPAPPTLAEELAVVEEAVAEVEPVDADAVLEEMLGALGAARHRPFSRG